MHFRIDRRFVIVAVLFVAAGCGGPKAVTGQVVFKKDGRPFTTGGYIRFEGPVPATGNFVGSIDPNGRFILNKGGAPPEPGDYRVCIQPFSDNDVDAPDPAEVTRARARFVAARFLEFRTSGVICAIKADQWVYVIEVDRPAER